MHYYLHLENKRLKSSFLPKKPSFLKCKQGKIFWQMWTFLLD